MPGNMVLVHHARQAIRSFTPIASEAWTRMADLLVLDHGRLGTERHGTNGLPIPSMSTIPVVLGSLRMVQQRGREVRAATSYKREHHRGECSACLY